MLVTRQCDTGRNTWSSRKFEDVFHNAASPRMSNFDALAAQPDWRDQYSSFPLSSDTVSFHGAFEQGASDEVLEESRSEQHRGVRPPLEHRHTLSQLRQEPQPVPVIERPDSAPGDCSIPTTSATHDSSLISPELTINSIATTQMSSTASVTSQTTGIKSEGSDIHGEIKDEDDEDELDDDEMLDPEEGSVPQTAAERRAERRKMKRFRLTHQQTRFLMSEFAKQAHPDAAHRERLSREIPGLSPRQVQVWFQNRRAKIKRLTADDRERMMKMRAVPDDFDNVQALHSPYGAVHGLATPMQSPVDFVPSFADHMMRPLMVDTMRRNEHDEQHMSPTGLSPAFGHVGFGSGTGMNNSEILSPLSINSNDRYFGGHMSSPLSAGPRTSNPFDRQNAYQNLAPSRQHVRSLQPLQLRETMSRSRSESLQSPLRSSMSWKGETLDYGNYQTGQPSPQLNGRQQSVYQPEQGGNNSVNANQYDGNSFPNTSMQSPPSITYAISQSPSVSLQQSSPSAMSRIRASSSTFPPGLDLRIQYRPLPSHSNISNATPRSASFVDAFSGYASAPLTAPVDFSLPQTPVDGSVRQSNRDFNIPQLSAPMAAPQDFSSAFNANMSPRNRVHQQGTQRDFSHQSNQQPNEVSQHQTDGQGQTVAQHQHSRSNEDASYPRSQDYEPSLKRKRSYTVPGSGFESP